MASDIEEEAVPLPPRVCIDAPAPAPDDSESARRRLSSQLRPARSRRWLHYLRRRRALSRSYCGESPERSALDARDTSAAIVRRLRDTVERSLNEEDFETAHIAAKAADACVAFM